MTETISQMKQRHEREIAELQEQCKHTTLTAWLEEWWAPGHSTGRAVKCCEVCEKIIERKPPIPRISGECVMEVKTHFYDKTHHNG